MGEGEGECEWDGQSGSVSISICICARRHMHTPARSHICSSAIAETAAVVVHRRQFFYLPGLQATAYSGFLHSSVRDRRYTYLNIWIPD